MNVEWAGLIFAATTVSTIAIGHVLVRRLHPVFGTRPGTPFMIFGVTILILSGLTPNNLLSGVLGIVGLTTFWDGIEFFRQEKRAQREKNL